MTAKIAMSMLWAASILTVMVPTSLADGYDTVYYAQNNVYNPGYNAQPNVYNAQTSRYGYRIEPEQPQTLGAKIRGGFRDLWHTPAIKKGALGAGVGLGAAALTEKNLLRGSAIGAGIGAGIGLMDESRFFTNHPLVRRTGKGALVGVGAAAATGAAALLPAAAVGAGVGAGIHYIKHH